MQSQGSTSSQPSFDSLSSSDSLLLSDSEPAEDDADVFLTDSSPSIIIGGVVAADGCRGLDSPGSQWACDGYTDKEEEEESERKSGSKGHLEVGRAEAASQSPKSQGDLLFAQKCAELQGFVRPLLELLNGLKRGRFERGLSSFQQSVAMDRIQRIVGVLQRPNCGEKYLNTLLQVEMMLKLWFPQIPTHSAPATSASPPTQTLPFSTPPHKHRDQLHIPVKKRRLSWTDTGSPSPSLKRSHTSSEDKREKQDPKTETPPPSGILEALPYQQKVAADHPPHEEKKAKDNDSAARGESSNSKTGQGSGPNLTRVHGSPNPSPPKACLPHKGTVAACGDETQHVSAVSPPTGGGNPATQDSSVSSTTPSKHPKNQKMPILCQSQSRP